MQEVLVNCLGGLSLPRKSVVRLTDCPNMILDVTVNVKQQSDTNSIPYLTFLAPCALNFFRVAANFLSKFFSFKRTF